MTNVNVEPKVGPIEPTVAHAMTIQRLKLASLDSVKNDLLWAPFTANPYSPRLVSKQLTELQNNPGGYIGAFVDGRLSGYAKTGAWLINDGLPFSREEFQKRPKYPALSLGIFGLAVSYKLDDDIAEKSIHKLLDLVSDKALKIVERTPAESVAVNIPFFEHDFAQEVAIKHAFKVVGLNEALRRSGIVQRLYSKTIDLSS